MRHFWTQNGPFALNFFWKIIKIILIYLSAPFIVQNQIQSFEDAQFLGPKWPISPNENIFQKTYQWALFLSFMPIYMPKIKVSFDKNFHFTQIPDKTNDMIFLKRNVFGPFLTILARWGFFPKNLALSHTTIYGPLVPC